MPSSAVIGGLVGFIGALLTIGVPLVGFIYRTNNHATRAVRLLTGAEEIEGDGVIPRLRDVEERSTVNRVALADSDIEIPADAAGRYVADGGKKAD